MQSVINDSNAERYGWFDASSAYARKAKTRMERRRMAGDRNARLADARLAHVESFFIRQAHHFQSRIAQLARYEPRENLRSRVA